MIRTAIGLLIFLCLTVVADAQGCGPANANCIVPTAPPGTNNNQAASTAFVQGNPSAQLINVTRAPFNADPTGTNANFGTAFNAAMTQCRTLGSLGIANNGTVYIPPGFYKIGSTGMIWLQGCNILADHAAYIQANVSIPVMLSGNGVGSTNTLQEIYLEGGQWDCNANVTQDGLRIQDFTRLTLASFHMYGCNGAAGNGSIGGFIRLGASGSTQFNALDLHDVFLYNFTSPVTTLVAGNYGIFTDPSGSGVTDSWITNTVVAGTSIAYQGVCFDCIFYNNHAFVFSTQGNMVNGFKLTSGQIRLTNNQVDGPIVSANAAYDLSGTKPYTLVGNGFFEGTNNNVSNAVNVGAGTIVKSYGNHWIGNSASFKILNDYTGTLTNLSVIEDYNLNVSTVVGGAWQAFTATPTCGTATFTTNTARSRTIAKNTSILVDFSITSIGSCVSPITFTIPVTTQANTAFNGINSNTGALVSCVSVSGPTTTISCYQAAFAAYAASGRIIAGGTFENQ